MLDIVLTPAQLDIIKILSLTSVSNAMMDAYSAHFMSAYSVHNPYFFQMESV